MKIYIVIVKDGEDICAAWDWWGNPYEPEQEQVFFDYGQAKRVFDGINKHGTTYEVSLHEFEV